MTQENLLPPDNVPEDLDPNKDYYQELVGETKKFKDNQALARGKFESDNYIKILERRLDDLRSDYKKMHDETTTRARLEDLVDQLTKQRQASSETPPANEDLNQPKYDPKEVESLVSTKLQEIRQTERQTENFNMVRQKLEQRYGPNYKTHVQKQIEELGISEQELNDLARRQPKMLIKTLGLDQQPASDNFQAPPQSNRRSDSFAPTAAPARTWSWYEDLRKKDKNLYFDRKTAVQMQKDAIELGDKFYDGNFYVPGLHEKFN